MTAVGTPSRFGVDRARLGALGSLSTSAPTGPEQALELTPTQWVVRKVAAVLFSWLFVLIPWFTWRPRAFKDVNAYVAQLEALRANNEVLDFDRLTSVEYIVSEPLWRQILATLDLTNDPRDALTLVTFFVVLVFSSYMFVRVNPWFAAFIMFNPSVIDLVVSQTRSATAAAFALVAASSKRTSIACVLMVAAALIHTLTFMFLAVYCVAKFLERMRHKADYLTLCSCAFGIGVAFAILFSLSRAGLLQAVGDRRGYVEDVGGNTISYTIYWVLLAGAFTFTYRLKNEIVWRDFYSVVIMVMPLVTTIFHATTARLIPLTIPFIVEGISARPKALRLYMASSLIAYQLLHYSYWLG